MKYTYQVSQDDYLAMLASMIRKQDAKPFRRLLLVLLTIGQMGMALWLCLTRLEKSQRVLLMTASVLLAALIVFWTFAVRFRAKGMLGQVRKTGQLPEDFWKLHRLEETKEGLALSYGSVRLVCDAGRLSFEKQENGQIWIQADSKIFDIVPDSAFPSEERKESFLAELGTVQEKAKKEKSVYENEEDGDTCELQYPMDGKEWIRSQAAAFRAFYVRYRLFEKISVLKIAATVALIVLCVFRFSYGTAAMTAAFAVLLNDKHFVAFSPLLKRRIRKETGRWEDAGQIRLSALKNGIIMRGGSEELFVPYSHIQILESPKLGRVLAWEKMPAVIIPEAAADTEEGKAFLEKVKNSVNKGSSTDR
ncbi:MAG: hypothetical protein IJJ50_05910 [Lachnospiraceae bacterium]|nr:hypothetical protein [Lachnospiraceae bacterium]